MQRLPAVDSQQFGQDYLTVSRVHCRDCPAASSCMCCWWYFTQPDAYLALCFVTNVLPLPPVQEYNDALLTIMLASVTQGANAGELPCLTAQLP